MGIGGRLDSTNIIPPPLCGIVVSIGLDHQNLLGDTLPQIASEKAGIFKPGSVGVTAVPAGDALDVIQAKADSVGIPLYRVAPAKTPDAAQAFATYAGSPASDLTITLPSLTLSDLSLTLRAAYQAQNAATAAAAIETLRLRGIASLSPEAFRQGLQDASLPGRFQILRREPAVLLLDGAHNEDGAQILVQALKAEFGRNVRCTFVLGMSKNHDPRPFVTLLSPLAERIIATEPPFKPRPFGEVIQAAEINGIPVTAVASAKEAIQRAYQIAKQGEIVVVTGSFFTIGETPESLRS